MNLRAARTAILPFAALWSAALTAPAQADADARLPEGPGAFAIRARAIYPVTRAQPGPIPYGIILVRNGQIEAVGPDLSVPPDVPLIELPDHYICPGFINAASPLAGSHTGPESVSGAYRAIDAFDTYSDYVEILARGTTTVHVDPGAHRLVTGVGAVVRLAGPPHERILSAEADLCMNLGAYNPPRLIEPPFFASSDVPIRAAQPQRPDSRLGQLLEIEERIANAKQVLEAAGDSFDRPFHWYDARQFARHWLDGMPLRIQAHRAADIEQAVRFVRDHKRRAVLVGMTQAAELTSALLDAGLPAVVRIEETYDQPGFEIGNNPNQLEPDLSVARRLVEAAARTQRRGRDLPVALSGREDEQTDLQMVAMLAMRGGLSPEQALAAVTRVPAKILGVGDRVGTLEPSKDADFLVLSEPPLEVGSHVAAVYVRGRKVFEPPRTGALVVRAGTVWVGDGSVLHDASVLIEGGKIQAVGRRVPQPPFARVIDAGRRGFVTPGFIDAHGHLGLEGDTSAASSDVPLHEAIGVATREFVRVARSGVTTVMMTAYRAAGSGARVVPIKTFGATRDDLVLREVGGLKFSIAGKDPFTGLDSIRQQLEKGKKYDGQWKKYYEELEKWKKAKAEGKQVEAKPQAETEVEKGKPDPITGTWEFTISGGPMPEPINGEMRLKLTGKQIEGRATVLVSDEEAVVHGTLEGDQVRMEFEAEDSPMGNPVVEATLEREDYMRGVFKIGGRFTLDFEADRTARSPVEFKVKRKRSRRKGGEPEPPKVDESLEPYRPLLAGRIPALVEVRTPAEAVAILKLFVDEHKIPVVLLGAEQVADAVDALSKRREKVGVVVPPQVIRKRDRRPYLEAGDLARQGVRVALQSDAEDGSRSLPYTALYAVQRGLGGDNALRALTIDAAKMFGLDDRVGSLEPGKDADLLIHSGYPFDAGSRIERVIVGGREVPDDE